MGDIEDTIYKNYKRALEQGNLEQAKLAVELAKELKSRIENKGFSDYIIKNKNTPLLGSFFEPYPYRYYPESGIVVIDKSAVNLTPSENRLFYFFSNNESNGLNLRVVTKRQLKEFMWKGGLVTTSAIRTAIRRLRKKIEVDAKNPQMLINYYSKGYIFIGKQIYSSE